MKTRGLVGSCLVGLWSAGYAAAQVVIIPPPIPVFIPDPVPVVVEVPGVLPTGTPPAAEPHRSNYPPSAETQQQQPQAQQQPQRPLGPRVVHERHYLSPTMNVSNYMASKSGQTYGPETMVVIRDFYITDEPPPKKSPPPVGSGDDAKPNDAPPPRNSTDAQFDGMLGGKTERPGTPSGAGTPSGVNVPNPAAADRKNGVRNGGASTDRNYPPVGDPDEKFGPPAPSETLASDAATSIIVASRNGGTPMAEMELNFVDLAGKHNDVKGRTNGKGQMEARLAPSRWHVFLVVGENERKSLGVILVKPTPSEPFKLQF